jgi:hypothetical protein
MNISEKKTSESKYSRATIIFIVVAIVCGLAWAVAQKFMLKA